MSLVIRILMISVLLFSYSTSAEAKSEHRQYQKLQKGFFFKAYSKLSRETVRSIADTYNEQLSSDQDKKLSRAQIHSLLGLMWSMGLDADYAIADSLLSLKKAKKTKDKYIAHSALSLALYNKGWISLARKQSALLQTNEFRGYSKKYEQEELFANLIVGSLAIREGNLQATQDTFGKVALKTGRPWIVTLAKTAALTMNGSIINAASQFKAILDDPSLTEYERKKIRDMAKLSKKGQRDSQKQELSNGEKTKMTQKVSNLLFESIERQSKSITQELIGDLKSYTDSIG
ncbi:hypothetical protein MD588_08455 [Photobacterium sp. SDRW27]|uniref:hypothetical protein n=1 Tax=Photobacterium obscurum TaxID=2829490 RepID=UPI002244C368|nr:hypothetical protein [Photobacterium obscurum]MCW8328839.1 hypothetical protein [Photobacterium obscurum]